MSQNEHQSSHDKRENPIDIVSATSNKTLLLAFNITCDFDSKQVVHLSVTLEIQHIFQLIHCQIHACLLALENVVICQYDTLARRSPKWR